LRQCTGGACPIANGPHHWQKRPPGKAGWAIISAIGSAARAAGNAGDDQRQKKSGVTRRETITFVSRIAADRYLTSIRADFKNLR